MKNFRRHWTLRTASDITIALDWYYCNTNRGHFYYHEKFITDSMKIVIPSGQIFGICLLSNEPIFTITGGFLWQKI